ncbi:MAG: SDR family NAD(P)-dependent oxidoreductase, partial [Pseudomonadota bacterium]
MEQKLAGKTALITGASRGIGAVIAKRLAADGAAVTLTYVGAQDAAVAVVQEVTQAGGQARAIHADAREIGASAAAVADAVTHHGKLDILVSNAGINISKPIESLDIEDYSAVFDINVRANFEIIKAALEEAGSGLQDIVRTRVILTDIDTWKDAIEARKLYCKDARPADTIMAIQRFVNPEWLVEIEVDAVIS